MSQRRLEQLSPLQLYMKEVAKYPLLSPEDEYSLAIKHYDDEDVSAAHRLVTSNLRLVVKIANEFKQSRTFLLDLIQEGNSGLMQAVKKFNPYKGVKLSTYAAWWIKAYILKYILENRSQVKLATTAAQKKLFFNLKRETEKLLQIYDKADTKLLAEKLDVKEKDVVEMQKRLSGGDVSLEAKIGESGMSQGDLLKSDRQDIDELLSDAQLGQMFHEHIEEFRDTLKERDQIILKERLLSETPKTLQEIGNDFGVSKERVRQLEANIVSKLKKFVENKGVIDI